MDAEQFRTFLERMTSVFTTLGAKTGELAIPQLQLDAFDEDKETWDIFIKRLENFFSMKKIVGDETEVLDCKRDWLIHSMGAKTLQLLCNLVSPEEPKTKTYAELNKLIKAHLHPTPSVIAEQNKFSKRIQREGENVSNFVADLRRISKNCDFKCSGCQASTANDHLRQQFISGIRNSNWLEKLIQLKEPKNTFADCVDAAISMETAQKDSKEIQNLHSTYTVNQHQIKNGQKGNYKQTSNKTNTNKNNDKKTTFQCYRCGNPNHLANNCSHNNTICSKCTRKGHLAKMCKNGAVKSKNHKENTKTTTDQKQLAETITNPNTKENNESQWFMNKVSAETFPEVLNKPGKFMLDVFVDNIPIQLEFDTGAAVSSISHNLFKQILPNKNIEQSTQAPLRTYTGEIIRPIGYVTVQVTYNNETEKVNLYVMPGDVDVIFGREWLSKFKVELPTINQIHIPTVNDEIRESEIKKLKITYPEIFQEGIGKITDFKANLFLKEDAKPMYFPPRKVPYAIEEKVNTELDRLEEKGIITKIQYSEWGTPVVPIVKKDGSIRLCADYKITLNKILKDDNFPMPNFEDIFATTMMGGKIFSKLDISEAYLHMEMNDRSAEIQAISTTKGNYKVNRLMFGTKVAPAIWQRYISQLLFGIPGVCVFLDDIKIQGTSLDEHIQRLHAVLKSLQKANIRIKESKCEFFKSSIKYLGHIISDRGLEKCTEKIDAVVKARTPTNVTEVKSWLGLVNYYGKFFKNLSTKLRPLYDLLKKDVKFCWTKQCGAAFEYIKKEITSAKILTPFNNNLPLILAVDASPFGLGAVLSHEMPNGEEQPIAYASRSLTAAEKNYSQIDKEATAIFWGVNRFFSFCYGRKFKLITDHKPLVSIFNPTKKLPNMVANRMLRYAQFLQGFDFEIVYKSTNQHGNADAFSRIPSNTTSNDQFDEIEAYQLQQFSILPITFKDVVMQTRKDKILQKIYNNLLLGEKFTEPGFGKGKELEFALLQGCIVRGDRIVVPEILRQPIIEELHTVHIGIVKMKALARSYLWWPNIDENIEEWVKKCKPCQSVQKQSTKGTLHPWEFPSAPWQRLHVDFAGPFLNTNFLLVVDAYSKWPEIVPMNSITATKTIAQLRDIFARFGLPVVLVSDNGSTFTSEEFTDFCKSNSIIHKFSAPYHPATNGQVERYVQTMKDALRKSINESGNLQLKLSNFLLTYRKTPNSTTNISPCMLLMNRDIRTLIDLIRPNFVQSMRGKQAPIVYKKNCKKFHIGDVVQVRNYNNKEKKWEYGKIAREDGLLHYYIDIKGQLWRRHVDQIKSSNVELNEQEVEVEYDFEVQHNEMDTSDLIKTNEVNVKTTNVSTEKLGSSEMQNDSIILNADTNMINVEAITEQPVTQPTEAAGEKVLVNKSIPPIRRSSRIRKPVTKMNL